MEATQRTQEILEQSAETKRSALSSRLAELNQDYTLTNRQIGRELNDVNKERLKRQLKSIEQEMDQVEAQLNQLDQDDYRPNRRHLRLVEKLPEIDFREVKAIANRIINQFGRDGGAALFLLEKSHAMAGDLFVAALREQLSKNTGDFRHYPIRFTAAEGRLDEIGILDRLARWVNVQTASDIEQYVQEVVRQICGSLQSNSIVFFELNRWENLVPQEQMLTWFLEKLWLQLVSQRPDRRQDRRCVKFIAVLTSDKQLSPGCLQLPCFCDESNFDSTKVLNLPLRHWTETEIEEWLENFSGLSDTQITAVTQNVYEASYDGIPQLVRSAIEKEFE